MIFRLKIYINSVIKASSLIFSKDISTARISLAVTLFFIFSGNVSLASRNDIHKDYKPKQRSNSDSWSNKISEQHGRVKDSLSKQNTYTGTVVPIVVETMSSGTDAYFYGTVESVARVGAIITPQITDMDGNVVEQGTIVMQEGTKYWKAQVEGSKALLAASEQDLKTATENYNRYKELSTDGAESLQKYQEYQMKYFDALGECEKNKGTLQFNQRMLETRTQLAPFEGIVTKVLYIMGRASGNPQTVELTQLNPIGIKIKMSREEANKINASTPVTVYQLNSDHKQGVLYGYSFLCDDGIILATENHPETLNKNIPEVRDCYSVDTFHIDDITDKALGVPENSLVEGDNGYYVMKAKNRRFLIPDKGLNPTFKVEKISVVPGNLRRLHGGFTYIRILKDPGSLKEGDVLLTNPSKSLQSGNYVDFLPERYVFMPNEAVKVIMGK